MEVGVPVPLLQPTLRHVTVDLQKPAYTTLFASATFWKGDICTLGHILAGGIRVCRCTFLTTWLRRFWWHLKGNLWTHHFFFSWASFSLLSWARPNSCRMANRTRPLVLFGLKPTHLQRDFWCSDNRKGDSESHHASTHGQSAACKSSISSSLRVDSASH